MAEIRQAVLSVGLHLVNRQTYKARRSTALAEWQNHMG